MSRVGSAHAKAILIGEHAVVHGVPAIALPVALELQLELGLHPAPYINREWLGWFAGLDAQTSGSPLVPARVDSEIPRGAGLGSSAAFGVAALRALYGGDLSQERLLELADQSERIFHGNPSGTDVRAVAANQPLRVRRQGEKRIFSPVMVAQPMHFELWVTPAAKSTSDMVARVSEHLARRNKAELLAQAAALVDAAERELIRGDAPALGRSMNAYHEWLREVGASAPLLDDLVETARRAGALGAKLTGAGGGGAVLSLWPGTTPSGITVPAGIPVYAFELAATQGG